VALQRTGKLGTFASSVGQEAIGVGVASAMRADDVLFPSYRDHAAQLLRGVTMTVAMAYELEHDPAVVLLGEDIGVNGGVFRATVGLQARFGTQRVI
ncbi:thiamine pyrophosphate-dependent enzyme, partial [Paraburkholderia hospita]|uniref:thiamine pyrophosphate-dependent enzyme n=1 Tax=Paraburkholderia hospita TaxID=169430 RepID=UPI001F5FF7B1